MDSSSDRNDVPSQQAEIDFDLTELRIGFMTAFVPEDISDEEQVELDALLDELRFAFTVDPQIAEMTAWFDLKAGLVRQPELSTDTHLVVDINVPDETTGELTDFAIDMDMTQEVTYQLLGSSAA